MARTLDIQNAEKQVFLAGEMIVETTFGCVGGADDVLHRGAEKPLQRKQFQRFVYDIVSQRHDFLPGPKETDRSVCRWAK